MFRPLHPIFLPNEPALELLPRRLDVVRPDRKATRHKPDNFMTADRQPACRSGLVCDSVILVTVLRHLWSRNMQ
jgi:hypothetical protein